MISGSDLQENELAQRERLRQIRNGSIIRTTRIFAVVNICVGVPVAVYAIFDIRRDSWSRS